MSPLRRFAPALLRSSALPGRAGLGEPAATGVGHHGPMAVLDADLVHRWFDRRRRQDLELECREPRPPARPSSCGALPGEAIEQLYASGMPFDLQITRLDEPATRST